MVQALSHGSWSHLTQPHTSGLLRPLGYNCGWTSRVARILTAVAPDTEERIRRILAGHKLFFVTSIADAKAALDDNIKLVFVGARFDESRMFDLIEHIRQDVEQRKIPIVAAIIAPTMMSRGTLAGLAHATKIFGASVFVNLNDFADDQTQNTRLRIIVDALLLPPDAVPRVAQRIAPLPE